MQPLISNLFRHLPQDTARDLQQDEKKSPTILAIQSRNNLLHLIHISGDKDFRGKQSLSSRFLIFLWHMVRTNGILEVPFGCYPLRSFDSSPSVSCIWLAFVFCRALYFALENERP